MRQMLFTSAAVICALSAPALAQNSFDFTLGAGVKVAPSYFGADDTSTRATGKFRFEGLTWNGMAFGGGEKTGVGIHGSARFIGARDASDYAALTGLNDVDASIELGLGAHYKLTNFEAFADLRYGVIGHNSFVAEAGADVIARPNDRLTLTAGPRFLWGDEDYMNTYFGVSAPESAASGLPAYALGSGLATAGLEIGASYQVNDTWGVEGKLNYDRIMHDAGDSPIVQERDQLGVSVALTRSFSLSF